MTNWFEIDKQGLARLREGAPKSSLIFELVQNAWDTDAKRCAVELRPVPNTRHFELIVEDDDPGGFIDLSHAYTLFADSAKKDDSTKRGRFNLGEKLVLALCKTARIESVTGTISFDESGRHHSRKGTKDGSRFTGIIRMTAREFQEACVAVRQLIPPSACATTFNGAPLPSRVPAGSAVGVTLPSVLSDGEGTLRATRRKTNVLIYEPRTGEAPMIYEMGIPVVESGDRYHYDVQQKVPLTLDRTNVTPAFLREIRKAVAETMVETIDSQDANHEWARSAAAHPEASPALVAKVFTERFGDRAAIYDPSDREANMKAVSEGYTLVTGSQLSREEWINVKGKRVEGAAIALPAGQLFPTHAPKTAPTDLVTDWTSGMNRVADFCRWLSEELWGEKAAVQFIDSPLASTLADFGSNRIRFNVGRLGRAWFEGGVQTKVLDLIIHEFGHHYESNHLDKRYYEALSSIGARAVALALEQPGRFKEVVRC